MSTTQNYHPFLGIALDISVPDMFETIGEWEELSIEKTIDIRENLRAFSYTPYK
jgi:hypothetical protein